MRITNVYPAYSILKGFPMTTQISEPQGIKNIGWRVTFAAMGINLALGILYSWSVISKNIPAEWQWSETDKSWPYAFACLVFSIMMVPAGRLQDKIGPRFVAVFGGLLVGIGFIIASFTTSSAGYILGFGILAGTGIGFGYASATPPAVKWFPKTKTGQIAGIVVAGFGLASVYTAPLTKYLIDQYQMKNMMLILGIAFMIVVVTLSQLLKAPPKGYVPSGATNTNSKSPVSVSIKKDFTAGEMLSTSQFYMLWFMYACGAGAGLMIISKLAAIAKIQAGVELGFILVAVLAIGNGAGRIISGSLSDKIGRNTTMFICFVMQAILILLLSRAASGNIFASIPALVIFSALIGANYGANLALFPSITKDYYGLENFGVNYGLVFTAWGVGGFMLSLLAGKLYDTYKTFSFAYYGAAVLLILAAVMVFTVKPPQPKVSQ
jgi:MFS transporter, OFA family, oxalate/formate antiporter